MRTAIVNKHKNPELYEALETAVKEGAEYQGCFITEFEEYKEGGQMIGLFTLREADD